MRIFLQSASTPVRQTLAAVVTAAGHSIAADAQDAELTLVDATHPSPSPLNSLAVLRLGGAHAEDSIACPLRPQALIGRLKGWEKTQNTPLANGWALALQARTLSHPLQPSATLTEKECGLLMALARAYPSSIAREALLDQVWGITSGIDTHTLETHIYRLRSKLEALTPTPGDIRTENGAYALVFGPDPR